MATAIGLLLALLATAGGTWAYLHRTYHLATVDAGKLYRSGNVEPRLFSTAVEKVKPRTIVSLFDDREIVGDRRDAFENESAIARAKGIELVRIDVTLGGWPTTAQVRQFLAAAADPARQPVLIHCAQGVRRTGMMVAAYQESVLGYDREKAKAAMLTFGHSRRTVDDIGQFIDVYDPERREMTRELEQSKAGVING